MSITFCDFYRFAYPSKNITLQTVVQPVDDPLGIAIDSTNDHIYWTTLSGTLSKCNLDGTNITTIVYSLNFPWEIRLDITNR